MDVNRTAVPIRYAPLILHLSFYATTCFIGALLFYFGYGPFLLLVDYFSGIAIPVPYPKEHARDLLLLLFVAPLMLSIGYAIAIRYRLKALEKFIGVLEGKSDHTIPKWFPLIIFAVLAVLGSVAVARGGGFDHLGAWNNYGVWVQARWALFATLGFFSFVNLYTLLAVATAWVYLACPMKGMGGWMLRALCLALLLLLAFFLFQKRVLVTSLLFIIFVVVLHRVLEFGWERNVKRLLLFSIVAVTCLYFLLVVAPVYSTSSQTADQVIQQAADKIDSEISESSEEKLPALNGKGSDTPVSSDPLSIHTPAQSKAQAQAQAQTKAKLHEEAKAKAKADEQIRNEQREKGIHGLLGSQRSLHVFFYSLLAPMTRTSAPAMFYPIIFPSNHAFYGFDFGQDILGIGAMPDDNKIVWQHMYPDTPGGSIAAPFQFVLYSQVGILGTILLCFIFGCVIGGLWRVVIEGRGDRVWRSLMGGILLMFSGYMALDSVRGSLLASYGVIWGWIFIILAFQIGRKFGRSAPQPVVSKGE
ncbi:hypothetical protein [Pseudomonas sp. RIT-PI-S]|uniref:hypothetical protein n=1 Tax=Pseudomonas sp. RIT-PI-S TaxID=3035295 RepID=UPI0021D8AFFA|nr:hypothetical protein [Pseudomonas sp. RIT-PI-S]